MWGGGRTCSAERLWGEQVRFQAGECCSENGQASSRGWRRWWQGDGVLNDPETAQARAGKINVKFSLWEIQGVCCLHHL